MSSPSTDRRLGLTGNKAYKAPCDVATTANITLSGEQTIDGVTTSSSRVLVWNQSNTVDNGIWDSSTGSWSRAIDCNTNQDIAKGTQVLVTGGTSYAGQIFEFTSANPISPGTSAITIARGISSSTLEARLASTASAADGAGLVKASQSQAYAAGTLGARFGEMVSVCDYPHLADKTGVSDATSAFQAAFAKLGTSPGIVVAPPGVYKIGGKISAYAGQCLLAHGAVFDVSAYDGVFLSYNEADTFSWTNYYPPTVIVGGKVMGKVGTPGVLATFNPNFVFAKINRLPYATIKDIACYYAAPLWVLGESILTTIDGVRSYNPISNSFTFSLGSGGFGPNNSSMINCHAEEQKYPCSGVRIDSGGINITDSYLESLSTGIHFNGGYAALNNTVFGIRDQNGAQAMLIDQPCNLRMTGGNITFAGSAGGIAQTGFNINAASDITMTGVEVRAIDSAANSSVLFNVKAAVGGVIDGNTIRRTVSGTATTLFSIGNVAGAEYSGTFSNNFVFGDAGSTTTFCSNGGGVGTFAPTMQGNRFVRVSGFNALNGGLISNNQFIGSASTISWAGYTPGVLGPGNVFGSAGWTVTNASVISIENVGLSAAPTVAVASTITPTTPVLFVSGTTPALSNISYGGRTVTLIPTGLWVTNTAGNIALASTAVVSKPITFTFDSATAKWYPSY